MMGKDTEKLGFGQKKGICKPAPSYLLTSAIANLSQNGPTRTLKGVMTIDRVDTVKIAGALPEVTF
jgi:hypothetical protein